MISRLFIRNYAIIDTVEVEFRHGFNVITGETGAGKSIAIEALGLALGERGNTDVIRSGQDRAVVECEVELPKSRRSEIERLLEAEGFPPTMPLILRREVRNSGRSRAFINDTPSTVQLLKEIGDRIVDMHGQHEHQSLLNPEMHLHFLDEYAGYDEALEQVREQYEVWVEIADTHREVKRKQREVSEKEDLYKFQLKEINAVKPTPGELEELEQQRKILSNSQRIAELVQNLQDLLYEGERSVYDELVKAEHYLSELSEIDDSVAEFEEECSSASVTIREIGNFLNQYGSSLDSNPQQLDEIEERIISLRKLTKKYGPTLEDVLSYRDKISRMLDEFESYDAELRRLARKKKEAAENLAEACRQLHREREAAAAQFSDQTEEILHQLGMERASFRVDVSYRQSVDSSIEIDEIPVQVDPTGADEVEFYITTNPGEGENPLARIASGGEISRTMLAIKSVLAGKDGISTVIFDEIDIGISGRISRIVAEQLRELARYHQVICITHLPQIASLGDSHFVVGKHVEGGRTATSIRMLDSEERVREIATLVGGDTISETTMDNARELLAKAQE